MAKIPETIKTCIDNYVKYGYPPGGFCEAVLRDKLKESVERADLECRKALAEIVLYVYQTVPSEARGSQDAIDGWWQKLKLRQLDPHEASV